MYRSCLLVVVAALTTVLSASAGFAQDAAEKKLKDAVRFALAEEHVNSIENLMKRIAGLSGGQANTSSEILNQITEKRALADALSRILTSYFLAERLAPVESAEGEEFKAYVEQVRLLHEMIVLATKCSDQNKVELCHELRSLTKKLRKMYSVESDEVDTPTADNATPASPDESDAADPSPALDSMEQAILEATNAYRKGRGLSALKLDVKLSAASRDHSQEMNQRNYFSHSSPTPGKGHFQDRARAAGSTASAENIARQCVDPQMAMQMWSKSPGHSRNMSGPYSRIGIGRSDGYYTQMFGK